MGELNFLYNIHKRYYNIKLKALLKINDSHPNTCLIKKLHQRLTIICCYEEKKRKKKTKKYNEIIDSLFNTKKL